MSNNFATPQITIDTVMTAAYPPGVGYLKINDLTWTDQVSAGDSLVIKDRNGNLVADMKASAANVIERLGRIGRVNGIQVTTLVSGKVMIYLE